MLIQAMAVLYQSLYNVNGKQMLLEPGELEISHPISKSLSLVKRLAYGTVCVECYNTLCSL